jgi:hypothetical protein
VAFVGLWAALCPAQESSKITLDTSETLFTVLTTINVCGYDAELSASDPLRAEIRNEVTRAIQSSPDTRETVQIMCQLYHTHEQPDPSRTLAQYVSLALYLNPPPALSLKVKEAELPPDAVEVLGIVPVMQPTRR